MCRLGCTPSWITRVRNSPGVFFVTTRSKINCTRSGRPRSRLSRMISSKNSRPRKGRSKICVKLTSIWQMEVSLTQIFDRPLRGREFFEEIIRDNLDLGRPDRVQLIFDRVVTKKTPGEFRTRVIQEGVHPSLHINYKNFDLKQYFKEGRRCRTEKTFRNPNNFGVNKGLSNLPYLQKIGRQINRRLLEVERVSHNSGLSGDSIQRVVQPAVTEDGKKAPGLKFGQPRVMALLLALTMFHHLIDGFRNRDLRQQVADLLGVT